MSSAAALSTIGAAASQRPLPNRRDPRPFFGVTNAGPCRARLLGSQISAPRLPFALDRPNRRIGPIKTFRKIQAKLMFIVIHNKTFDFIFNLNALVAI